MAELDVDADPFTLHVYAALGEKERPPISERTHPAQAAKKARGAMLSNGTSLDEAHTKGATVNWTAADAFAANVLPVEREV